jgi:hypothetical protein
MRAAASLAETTDLQTIFNGGLLAPEGGLMGTMSVLGPKAKLLDVQFCTGEG